jgi:hypothetical protein
MNLVISKCVTAVKVSNFTGHIYIHTYTQNNQTFFPKYQFPDFFVIEAHCVSCDAGTEFRNVTCYTRTFLPPATSFRERTHVPCVNTRPVCFC